MELQAGFKDSQLDLQCRMQRLLLFSLAREASIDVLHRMKRKIYLQGQQLRQLQERELMQQEEIYQHDLQLQGLRERHTLLTNRLGCVRQDLQLYELVDRFSESGSLTSSEVFHNRHSRGTTEDSGTPQGVHNPNKPSRLRIAVQQQKQVLREAQAILKAHAEEAERLRNAIEAFNSDETPSEAADYLSNSVELLGGDPELLAIEERLFALEAEVEASLKELPALEGVQQHLFQQAISSIPDTPVTYATGLKSIPQMEPSSGACKRAESARPPQGNTRSHQGHPGAPLAQASRKLFSMRQKQHRLLSRPDPSAGEMHPECPVENIISMQASAAANSAFSSAHTLHEWNRPYSAMAEPALCKSACCNSEQGTSFRDFATEETRRATAPASSATRISMVMAKCAGRQIQRRTCNAAKSRNQPASEKRNDACPAMASSQGSIPADTPEARIAEEEHGRYLHLLLRHDSSLSVPPKPHVSGRALFHRSQICTLPCRTARAREQQHQLLSQQFPSLQSDRQDRKVECRPVREGESLPSDSERNGAPFSTDASTKDTTADCTQAASGEVAGDVRLQGLATTAVADAGLIRTSERLTPGQLSDEADRMGADGEVVWEPAAKRTASRVMPMARQRGSTHIHPDSPGAVSAATEDGSVGWAVSPVPGADSAWEKQFDQSAEEATHHKHALDHSTGGTVASISNCCLDAPMQQQTPQAVSRVLQPLAHANPYESCKDAAGPNISCRGLSRDDHTLKQYRGQKQDDHSNLPLVDKGGSGLPEEPGPGSIMACSSSPDTSAAALSGHGITPSALLPLCRPSADDDFRSSVGSGDNSPLLLSM